MSWTAFGLFPLRTLGSSEMKRFICSSASLRTLAQSPGAPSARRVTVGFSTMGKSKGTGPDDSEVGMPEEGLPVADLASLTGDASRALRGTIASCSVRAEYTLLDGC